MGKIGIISGAALATTFLAAAFYYHPSRTSDALLAKAQSEFVTKARNAVLERRAAEVSTNNVLATPPSSPTHTYVVASLEPVAPPSTARVETSEAMAAPVSTIATKDAVETPAVTSEPAKVEIIPAGTDNEVKAEATPPAAEPAAQPEVTAPSAPEVAAPQAVAPVTTPVVTETVAPQPAKVVQKITAAPSKKPVVAARRPGRDMSREQLPVNIEALRARAPQIAAALARYM